MFELNKPRKGGVAPHGGFTPLKKAKSLARGRLSANLDGGDFSPALTAAILANYDNFVNRNQIRAILSSYNPRRRFITARVF